MAHTTRYGNQYTDKEWAEMQAYFKAEKEKDSKISATLMGLEKFLRRQLSAAGLNKKAEDYIVRLFRYGEYEEAQNDLQFSSQSRKALVDDLWQRWNVAMDKVYGEVMNLEDDLEIKRLAIMEKE